jgi:glycosyltransferase involved in cell wall biosynthesis
VRHDAGTGIQRATKELLRELAAAPPAGYVVRIVQATRWLSYRYVDLSDRCPKVQAKSGDIFLGLDLTSRVMPRHQLQLLRWRAAGVRLCVVMHDLLPLRRPAWFTRRNARAYRAWIRTVAVHADLVVCVSRSVAEQLKAWLADQAVDPKLAPEIGWFHHGTRMPTGSGALQISARIGTITQRPFVLLVGTIEPRKGHAMVLDAFEAIWQGGDAMQLVLVGRTGWKVDRLVARLRNHAEAGARLHWIDDADDDTLRILYERSSGVLVASEDEGFGLPILEAAVHGKPLLIRDLPVFREVAADGAAFFRAETTRHFIEELREWLAQLALGSAVPSATIAVQTWTQSARQMLDQVLRLD